MKTIGILGGMGPYASIKFIELILNNTKTENDKDYPRIIMDSNTQIPSRTRALLYKEESPAKEMIKSINLLEKAGADFVVVPCNSSHYWYEEVSKEINIPWINMISVVSKRMKAKKSKTPLLFGGHVTVNQRLYEKYFEVVEYPSKAFNEFVSECILQIKKEKILPDFKEECFYSVIKNSRQYFDSILFACTELPLVFNNDYIYGTPCYDSSLEYAKEVVEICQ